MARFKKPLLSLAVKCNPPEIDERRAPRFVLDAVSDPGEAGKLFGDVKRDIYVIEGKLD